MCMLQLQETNPEIFCHFNEGHFVVVKSKRTFSSLGIDHAHEQNNKCVKGDGRTFVLIPINFLNRHGLMV